MNRSVDMKDDIIRLLSETPEITTTEIAKRLNASRTTVIHYLKLLRKDGIVSFRQAGPAKLWHVVPSEKGSVAKEISAMHAKQKHISEEIESFFTTSQRLGLLEDEDIKKLREARKILRKKPKIIDKS